MIHYGYAEENRQRVVDIFAGRLMPMKIDSEQAYALFSFVLDAVAHTVAFIKLPLRKSLVGVDL